MATVTAEQLVARMRQLEGHTYVFGAELPGTTPGDCDCSEGTEWAARNAGVAPLLPDGSGNQFRHGDAHGLRIPLEQAVATPGALLYKCRSDIYPPPTDRDSGIYHVALSIGGGRTIEVCCADGDTITEMAVAGREWYPWGTLVPGITYTSTPTIEEDTMGVITIRAGEPGEGSAVLIAAGRRHDLQNAADRQACAQAWGEAAVSRELYDRILATVPG